MNDRRPISGTTLFWSIETTLHGNDTAVYIVHALDPNATFNDSTTFFDNTAYKLRYCFNDPNDLKVPDCSREDQDTLKTPLYTTLNYTTLSQNSSNSQDSLIFGNDGCYAALGAEVTGYFYFDQIQDLVYEHHPCVSSYLRGDISNDAESQAFYNASRQEILTALRKLEYSDTMPQTIAGSGLTAKEFVLLHRLQRAGLLQLQRQGIMIPLKAKDLTYNLFAIDYEPNATYATNTLYIPDTILTYRHGVPSAYVSADQIIFGNNAFQSIPKEVQNYEPVIRVGRYNRILLPIFSATPGTFIKGVYLTETNNPDFQTLMPSVYKPANHPTVHPTRWNPADALSYPFDNNNAFLEIPLYPEWSEKWDGGGYTYYFTVEVGHDTTISHQSRVIGETRFCVKTVPDTLIWQPLAGSNNSWNADFNWRKANGDTAGNYTAATAGEGFVPMTTRLYDFMRFFVPGSYVIVPPQADGNYPVLPPDSNSIHHQNHIYNQAMNTEVGAQPFITYDQNYSNAGASKIAFGAGSMIQNQSALQQSLPPKDLEPSITDATGFYVDMPLLSRRWNFVSSPLEDTYTGDFYFADDAAADTLPFNLRPLGTRQTHPVWFRYYSDSVENVTNGPDNTIVSNAQWGTPSNQMGTKIDWRGGAVWAFDPADSAAHDTHIIMRLPKADTVYHYYERNSGRYIAKQQAVQKDSAGRLLMRSPSITIPLENKYGNREYVFGNPALAYLSWRKFWKTNWDTVEGIRYYFTKGTTEDDIAEIGVNNNDIISGDTTGTGIDIRYIKPMESVVIVARDKGPNADYRHATVHVEDNVIGIRPPAWFSPAPATEPKHHAQLFIKANCNGIESSASIALLPDASNSVVPDEDLKLLMLGGNIMPAAVYTVADNKALILNCLQTLRSVPIDVNISNNNTVDSLTLTFTGVSSFAEPLYFYDMHENTLLPLADGTCVRVASNNGRSLRYFIQTEATPTKLDLTDDKALDVFVQPDGSVVVAANETINSIKVFNAAGQLVTDKRCDMRAVKMSLPAGLYLLRVETATRVLTDKITVK